jgi:putative solute:sodium symporter small subunit
MPPLNAYGATEFATKPRPDNSLASLKAGGSEVASEAPLSDRPARDRHQLRTLLLAIAILSTVLLAASLAIGAATWLNQYGFLHFPLGFYLLAQGLLIFIVVATFWFIRLQDRLDQTRSENEELG